MPRGSVVNKTKLLASFPQQGILRVGANNIRNNCGSNVDALKLDFYRYRK